MTHPNEVEAEPKPSSGGHTDESSALPTASKDGLFRRLSRGAALARAAHRPESESKHEKPPLDLCTGISAAARPTETIRFSVLFDLQPESNGSLDGATTRVDIACTGIDLAPEKVRQTVEVHFSQEWTLVELLRGDLAKVVTLAPSERVSLSVSRKRVDSLQRTTTEATEETFSSEDVSSAKEIYSVSRNSVRSRNWGVDARATIPIKGVELALGGEIGEQVSSTVNSALSEVAESTHRSSEQLRTSTRVEVREASESTTQYGLGRLLQNPYGDRAVDVLLYEVLKRYCIEMRLNSAAISMRIDCSIIVFDRAFVRRNSAFLYDAMLDQDLASEMSVALATTTRLASGSAISDRLASASRDALFYLFEKPNIFNVGNISGTDANLPASTFDAQLPKDGFEDSREEGGALFFTTLNFFYALYVDQAPLPDDRAVELALSIYESVGRRWLTLMDADGGGPDLRELLDENNFTEGLRRLSGFAAFVEGAVKPLVAPSDLERQALERERAAEDTLRRVTEHMHCNRRYYTERYLQYVSSTTRGRALAEFVDAVIGSALVPAGLDTSQLSTYSAYVDGTEVVVPGRDIFTIEWLEEQLHSLDPNWEGEIPRLRRAEALLAADGLHAEPVATPCTLSSLDTAARPIADKVVVIDRSLMGH